MSTKLKILAVSVLVVSGVFTQTTKTTTATISYEETRPVKEAREVLPEVLLKIALCESGNKQFTPAGDTVRGRANRLDLGRFQINEYWNGAEAKRLGFNLYTLEGNTAMALHLYNKNGTRDWNWSKGCWSRPLDVIKKEKGVAP